MVARRPRINISGAVYANMEKNISFRAEKREIDDDVARWMYFPFMKPSEPRPPPPHPAAEVISATDTCSHVRAPRALTLRVLF